MENKQEAKQQIYPEVSYGPGHQPSSGLNYGSTMPQPVPHPMYQHQQPPNYYQQTTTAVVMQQPQTQTNSLMVTGFEGHRDWQTGVCDCFNEPGICKSLYAILFLNYFNVGIHCTFQTIYFYAFMLFMFKLICSSNCMHYTHNRELHV